MTQLPERPFTIIDVLDEFARRDIKIRYVDGRLTWDAPPGAMTPGLRVAATFVKEKLVAAAIGAKTGHRWVACPACGEAVLTAKAGGRCRLTPGCKGRYGVEPGEATG